VKTKPVDHTSNNNLDSWQDSNNSDGNQDDDSADAWGWGDETGDGENTTVEDETTPEGAEAPIHDRINDTVREVTLTETYTISSMPDPVYNTIKSIIEDGATLTREM
jgi:hypothetical protein